MRFLRQSLSGLFLLAMTGALLVYAGSLVYGAVQVRMAEEPRPTRSRERVFSVTVIPAQIQQIEPVLTAFGQIESARTLDLRSGASGTVLEISDNFVEGGIVRAGERLVLIDPAEAQSALDRASSDLSDANLEAREAARAIGLARDELTAAREQAALRVKAFERSQDLATRGVGTSATVETAELAASSARQAVLARRQSLAQAEARIEQA
ncbi:MAG: efflux transporter periplasmic adaptor subunit, partial [Planktotalea arctica]